MNQQLFVLLSVFNFSINLVSYYLIRQVIWSIVWCDKGGKYKNIRKLKEGQSIISKFSMLYLKKQVNNNIKAFNRWIYAKNIHSFFVVTNIIVTLVLLVNYDSLKDLSNSYCIVYMILSFIDGCFFSLQFDINRNTKYDRNRIFKK